jgi:predicted nucleic acid-binding protein
MVLIDTSSWTHALRRKGDLDIRKRVERLVLAAQAAWCDVIQLELWHGARNDGDRETLRELEAEIPVLGITGEVWDAACNLGSFARSKGLNVPSTDLIIFACAGVNGTLLEHNDRHFDHLSKLLGPSDVPDRLAGR